MCVSSVFQVLSDIPQKTFKMETVPSVLKPLELPESLTVADALERVFRLPSVGSKRFLTSKVDRCVSGLIAQQQCVGESLLVYLYFLM